MPTSVLWLCHGGSAPLALLPLHWHMTEVFITYIVGQLLDGSKHLHHTISPDLQVHITSSLQRCSPSSVGHFVFFPGNPLVGDTKPMFPYNLPNLVPDFCKVRLLGPPDPLQVVKHKLAVTPQKNVIIAFPQLASHHHLQRMQSSQDFRMIVSEANLILTPRANVSLAADNSITRSSDPQGVTTVKVHQQWLPRESFHCTTLRNLIQDHTLRFIKFPIR